MIHRSIRRATLAIPVLASFAVSPAAGQSVLLRIDPEEGLVSRYVLEMESHVNAPMMNSNEPTMVSTIYSTQTVTGRDGDVIEYRVVTDSAELHTPAMPAMERQMPDISGQVRTMRLDTRGRVVEMPGADTLPAQTRQIMNQMNGLGLELPEGEVSPGDTWTAHIETNVPGAPGGQIAMTMNMTYTLVSVSGGMAAIEFEGPMTLSGNTGGMPMDGSGTVSGSIGFDVDRGRLTSTDTQLDFSMGVQGMTMRMNQTMSLRLLGS